MHGCERCGYRVCGYRVVSVQRCKILWGIPALVPGRSNRMRMSYDPGADAFYLSLTEIPTEPSTAPRRSRRPPCWTTTKTETSLG